MLGPMRRLVLVVGGMALVLFALMWWGDQNQGVASWVWEDGPEAVSCEVGLTATSELCLLAGRQAAVQAVEGHPERDVYSVEIDRKDGILVCWDAPPAPSGQSGDGPGCQHRTLEGELISDSSAGS